MTNGPELFMRLLAIEAGASRLEGAFHADPGLGMMWRSQAALMEACRSVGLEDIHIFEGDVIARNLENRLVDMEGARGTEIVTTMLRVMAVPGDIMMDTGDVLARCWRAGMVTEDAIAPDFDLLSAHIRKDLGEAPSPFLGALRATCRFRLHTEAQSPSAERLVFMVSEHALRREGGAGGPIRDGIAADLIRNIRSEWCLLPSVALTQDGFRAWSPLTSSGLDVLMSGLQAEMNRSIGSLPVLRRWRESARQACEGRGNRSRLRDLVTHLEGNPIVTPGSIATAIGVTERTGLNLVKQAEVHGILRCITGRRSWRVWAVAPMADRLRMRSHHRHDDRQDIEDGIPEVEPEAAPPAARRRQTPDRAEQDERTEAALMELDAAMSRADDILKKYRSPQE